MNRSAHEVMSKVVISEESVKNLMQFLDRVELKGLIEVSAMNDLIDAVSERKLIGDEESK